MQNFLQVSRIGNTEVKAENEGDIEVRPQAALVKQTFRVE